MMKVAISGSAGTGKSLLAKQLSFELGSPLIPEGIREYLLEHNLKDFKGMSPRETMGMQWFILNRKIEEEKKLNSFVADRCTADNVAYALRWCGREIQDVPKAQMKHYINEAKEHCKLYDAIFILPGGIIPLENDGVRSSNENYHYEMECMIMGLLHKWDIPFYVVESISLNERMDDCMNVIKLKIKEKAARVRI